MDTAQWPQGVGVVNKPMESSRPMLERKARPQKDQNLHCPRCNSTNTKFCYYNNYSLSQPRYFCKTCRRYWTEGGSLRNVPVGGGSRKNKRSTPSSSSTPSKKLPDLTPHAPSFASQNPSMHEGMQDLNLSFPPTDHQQHDLNSITKLVEVPFSTIDDGNNNNNNKSQQQNHTSVSAMDMLKAGITSTTTTATRELSSFMTMPVSDSNNLYSAGFSMQEFKPTLNFSLDGFEGGYGSLHGVQEPAGARLLFPVEDLKPDPNTTEFGQQDRGHGGDSNGYWNGMLGGGSW